LRLAQKKKRFFRGDIEKALREERGPNAEKKEGRKRVGGTQIVGWKKVWVGWFKGGKTAQKTLIGSSRKKNKGEEGDPHVGTEGDQTKLGNFGKKKGTIEKGGGATREKFRELDTLEEYEVKPGNERERSFGIQSQRGGEGRGGRLHEGVDKKMCTLGDMGNCQERVTKKKDTERQTLGTGT